MDGAYGSLQTAAQPAPTDEWARALARQRAGDTAAAITSYQRHLAEHPDDAEGWLALASALRRSACPDAALVCCQRAVRLAPDSAAVWSNLGTLWLALGNHEQSLRCHRNALAAGAAPARVRLEYARALRELGRFAQAESVLADCLAAEPERVDLLLERAAVRLQLGRYAQAWPDFEARLQLRPARIPEVPLPRWRGERIGGTRLLLLAERGLADALWALRFVPSLARRGAAITLVCPDALHPVLADLPLHPVAAVDPRDAARNHDLQCALLSLPGVVDPRGRLVPEPAPVAVPEDSRAWFAEHFACSGRALRVGIAWAGGEESVPHGGLPLRRLLALAAVPGVQLFSFQRGAAATELRAAGIEGMVVDVAGRCRHLGDTAAALERMDLLVAGDGVVARLAGAMMKPGLILLPHCAHWVYGRENDATPWYPTLRLLRQPEPGEWTPVFGELQRLVTRWADSRAGRSP